MQWGDFREYFRGFAWKRLTPHEVDPEVSNGHEFQGVSRLKTILGDVAAERLPASYILLSDDTERAEVLESTAKWYNAREGSTTRSPEWRLYYPADAGAIQTRMQAGDLMVVGVTQQRTLIILLAPAGSASERQLQLLFDIADGDTSKLEVRSLDDPVALDFITATLLERLGLGDAHIAQQSDAEIVERLVATLVTEYGDTLPSGDRIATLVRESVTGVDARSDPDGALYRWIETEAALYRGWEDRKIARRLVQGFTSFDGVPDVTAFRNFSMSIRQSRVSRAGGALQYHMRAILHAWKLDFVMEPRIDEGEIPDFVFPSKAAYEDPAFPSGQLRMLAAKFTAKDRWRQVLNEAKRIDRKHLLTMEATISRGQLALMASAQLLPVIPREIRSRYSDAGVSQILTVREFLAEIESIQRARLA